MAKPKPSDSALKDRKREQNRLSQRCLRERRLLQTRQAASVEEALKSSTTGSEEDKSEQIKILTAQMLQLSDQNKKLSEALLRMRKKFLSIGTASNMAAEDDIFEDLLAKPVRRHESSEAQESGSTLEYAVPFTQHQSGSEDHKPTALSISEEQQEEEGAREGIGNSKPAITTDGGYSSQGVVNTMSPEKGNIFTDFQTYFGNDISSIQIGDPWFSDYNPNLREIFDSMQNGYQTYQYDSHIQVDTDTFPAAETQVSASNNNVLTTLSRMRFHQCCSFTQSVEETCVSYALQLTGVKMAGKAFGRVPNSSKPSEAMTAVATHDLPKGVVDNLIQVAIYLIAAFAKVEVFLYGLGADKIMEAVLRWRISPSRETAAAIPAPFCPTPLQAFGPGHHIMVDCCVWPSIRDQLILHSSHYDMDELSTDMMQLTVLEIPYLKSAAPVLDLFVNDVFPEELGNGQVDQISGSKLKQPGAANIHGLDDYVHPVDSTLLNEIYRRLANGMASDINPDQLPPRSVLAPKFGLNTFHNWKLSKDFAAKYPFLDCTLAESQYPTISAATVLTVGLWVLSA